MNDEQFRSLIAAGRESESLEAKPGGSRKDQFLGARVVRAAIGMANHEGGGWIVIGIDEREDKSFDLVGIAPEHQSTWNHDDISAMINGCSEPHLVLDTFSVLSEGRTFCVIRVHEFVDIPVICRVNGPTPSGERAQIHKADVCYARSRRKPETIDALSDPTTWRTLIELASNKAAAKILKVMGGVPAVGRKVDLNHFESQLEDLR